jgi:haloalkane dehalogenase
MECKRTPDERFTALADYPFTPQYLQIADGEGGALRLHYLDEGQATGPVALLLHGQPSWSYLYRFMIPPLVEAGFRVVAPDLIGFGRSDKPTRTQDYTYARHIAWMSEWLTALALTDITLFCQDWGSLIGLRLLTSFPQRFSHVVLSNGGLPTGFLYWRKFCAESTDLEIGDVMQVSATAPLSSQELAAYNAPFPDRSYMAGARRFPSLVPLFHDEPEVEENKAAWAVLRQFDKPLMTFADSDPVTAGAEVKFQLEVPGARGIAHRIIRNAGHFVQQEQPQQCVQAILDITGRG